MARSPNYPQLNLADAIAKLGMVWKKEEWNTVPAVVVAEHLGYQSLSGTAQVTMSALKKYGLLQGSSDGLKVTKRGMTLVEFGHDTPEYKDALREAAVEPALFADLAEEHRGKALPSESNLRTTLLTRDFSSAAATKAARSYLETMSLVAEKANGYTGPDDEERSLNGEDGPDAANDARGGGGSSDPPPPPASRLHRERRDMSHSPPQGSAIREDVFSLAEGDVVLQWPGSLSLESYEDFKDWLGLIERKAGRAVSDTQRPELASLDLDTFVDPEEEREGTEA